MSRYIHFTKLKHLIFPNGGSKKEASGFAEHVHRQLQADEDNLQSTLRVYRRPLLSIQPYGSDQLPCGLADGTNYTDITDELVMHYKL
jgi:hypothetical protein